jgi:hypothetical protein
LAIPAESPKRGHRSDGRTAVGQAQIQRCSRFDSRFVIDYEHCGDPKCEGKATDGPLGLAHNTTGKPIYRCNREVHLHTTNVDECKSNGFTVEGVIGHAP